MSGSALVSPDEIQVEAPPPRQRRGHSFRRRVARYLPSFLLVVLIVIAWQILIRAYDVETFVFPAPTDVWHSFGDNSEALWSAAKYTFWEILLGFMISLVTGVMLAVLIHLVQTVGRAIYPLLIASQTVPTVVLAPLLVIVFGFGLLPKLGIIWLICFFPIVVNTVDGLASVDESYIRMMRTLHASRWAIFRRVEFPSAVPNIFTGARIGATYASIGAVLGEWSGADNGVGYMIQQAGTSLDTPLIIAGVVVLSAMTFVLFGAVSLAERILVPWAGER